MRDAVGRKVIFELFAKLSSQGADQPNFLGELRTELWGAPNCRVKYALQFALQVRPDQPKKQRTSNHRTLRGKSHKNSGLRTEQRAAKCAHRADSKMCFINLRAYKLVPEVVLVSVEFYLKMDPEVR